MQSIQSGIDERVNRAKALIIEVDNTKKLSKTKVTAAMTSLRRVIDEHEQTVLDQILQIEKDQKKQIEEYQTRLQNEQHSLDTQKSNFKIILSVKGHTKLLQAKPGFVDYSCMTNGTLEDLRPPILTNYRIEGLYQLQALEEQIYQCGQFVQSSTYCNPQLEQRIVDNQANPKLKLDNQKFTDQDMEVVADALRKSTVSEYCFINICLLFKKKSTYTKIVLKRLEKKYVLTECQDVCLVLRNIPQEHIDQSQRLITNYNSLCCVF